MSRIPEEEIERIKRETDLLGLIRSVGIELKSQGKDLIGLCPFHDDKTPSLVVTPKKNLWHCLGACGTGGGPIDWVMKQKKTDFKTAVNHLKQVDMKRSLETDDPEPPNEETPSFAELSERQALLKRVVDYYHAVLKKTPQALNYLKKRGLVHPDLINRFKLGFADRSLSSKLPSSDAKAGKDIRKRLIEVGIYTEKSRERFHGSLVIPIFGTEGTIGEIYGRKIAASGKLRKDALRHTYLPGPHKGFWNLDALMHKTLILCESLIDAMSFWVNGFENTTAAYGTEGFTDNIRQMILQTNIEKLYLAYDRDIAGNKAAKKVAGILSNDGIDCFQILFPEDLDANEYILTHQPGKRRAALTDMIAQAVPLAIRLPDAPLPGRINVLSSPAVPNDQGPTIPDSAPISKHPDASESDSTVKNEMNRNIQVQSNKEKNLEVQQKTNRNIQVQNKMDKNIQVQKDGIHFTFEDRNWRVRGLEKNLSYEVIRVNLKVERMDLFHLDSFDLYHSKARYAFLKIAESEIGVMEKILKKDLGRILFKLEQLQAEQIEKTLEPVKAEVKLSEAEEAEALEYLQQTDLPQRIVEDFRRCGMVGEDDNCLVGYLAATSRMLEKPLAVVVQSSSSAGKTTLMDAILSLMPEEEQERFTAMTGQALFYMGENDLVHKILAVSEEEGAERASYALKTLQSEGKLKIASTGKDPKTGRLLTQEYLVQGPVMILITTTNVELNEELENRCLILSVDESEAQTARIQKRQRFEETSAGLAEKRERERIMKLHQNIQRLLKPIPVVNPYAELLDFPNHRLRLRRDQLKYLSLIRSIALLHQYQREPKTDSSMGPDPFIEVTIEDIEMANTLTNGILGRSLDDLTSVAKNLLETISKMVVDMAEKNEIPTQNVRFTRRELRDYSQLGDTRLKVLLKRLEELEYLISEKGERGLYRYELLYTHCENESKALLSSLSDAKSLTEKIKQKMKNPKTPDSTT